MIIQTATVSGNHKIKLLRVMRGLKMGGIELRTLNLTKALNASGDYQCEVVTILDQGELVGQAAAAGIPVYHLPIRHRSDWAGILKLRGFIRQQQYQIVHTHSFYPNVPGRIAAILARAPVIVAHQHSVYGRKCKHLKHRLYERILAPFTDKIVAVSQCVKDDYVRFTGVAAKRVEVIYNGIDLQPFITDYDVSALRRELGLENRIVVGSIGRLVPVKNYPTLIAAAKQVSEVMPNVVFVIVGDGPEEYKNRLLAQIETLGLQNHVKLTGYRSDIPQLMQLFDLGVLTSHWEGFPGVILEFMASKRPIIASNSGGQAEILTPGKNGLLFSPDSPAELVAAILRLVQDAQLRQSLAENARLAAFEFSLDKMAANFDRFYRSLLKHRPPEADATG